jgi:hypothetical protein
MSGHRQAAVALYSLAESDQGAILAELPAADQTILRGYLAELAELGFDKAANSGAVPLAPPPADAQRASLQRASAAAMLSVLGQEPASLVAQLLSLGSWAWAPEFMELLTPARRALVREAASAGFAAAPAREQFLLAAIGAALRDLPAAPVPPGTRRFSASLARLVPWTR